MYDSNYYGTEDLIQPEEDNTPPDLCHKKLLSMVEKGEKSAIDFLSVFKPYESIDAAMAVEPEQVRQVLEVVRNRNDMEESELTFYYCDHVSPEGMCTIYERRPQCCRAAPGNGWSAMPPGCGFEGWQFEQREKQRRMVRDLKSSLYTMEQMSPDGVHHPLRPETPIQELVDMVNEKIQPWNPYGAKNW
jgi:Fe-S-cluster containining protein